MKIVRFLLVCIVTALVVIPMSSCSKDDPENQQDRIGVISINGVDHAIFEAGYTLPRGGEYEYTIVQFIIEDPGGPVPENKSTIELQFPTSLTEDWYTLAPNDPSWRITLQNTIVGNGADMGVISEGRVLIKQLGQIDKDDQYECRVAFEITLTDGTTAFADVQAKFKNSRLWIGGR